MKICNRLLGAAPYLLLASLLSLTACSNLPAPSEADTNPEPQVQDKPASAKTPKPAKKTTPEEPNLWLDLVKGYGLPQVSDDQVRNHLRWYGNNQRYIDRMVEQSQPFIYYVKTELAANGLPLELALLPIVESAYDPLANSPSKAAGIWQFMPHTGRNFGLQQNAWYDGRRDLIASTDAAVRYLSRLHKMFDGDWLLAIAAYNAGEGTVSRAIKRNRAQGKKADFWSLPLSQQTQSYVPQLLALSKVIANPSRYDLSLQPLPNSPYFTRVNLSQPVDMAEAARKANVDPSELRRLNAGHIKWVTVAPNSRELLVPIADATAVTLALNSLPKLGPIKTEGNYRVKSGDTLGALARRFGTSVAAIQQANHLKGHHLRIGQELAIPGQATWVSPHAAELEKNLAQQTAQTSVTRYYTVKSGDNAWNIARSHKISVAQLLKWNKLSSASKLKPGQKLIVAEQRLQKDKDGKITYKIQPGDTLYTIASRFEVSQQDLLSWNKVKDETYIHPGQELIIHSAKSN